MFKKILVPIDLQDPVGAARSLKAIAEYSGDEVELHLMSVLPGYQMPMVASYFPKEAVAKALATMEQELKNLAAKVLGERELSIEVCEGKAHQAIVKQADDIGADLIIIGAQKHGAVEKMMLGTVTAKVTERAKCSVLVLKS